MQKVSGKIGKLLKSTLFVLKEALIKLKKKFFNVVFIKLIKSTFISMIQTFTSKKKEKKRISCCVKDEFFNNKLYINHFKASSLHTPRI